MTTYVRTYVCLQRSVIRSCVPLHPLTNYTTHHLRIQCGSRPHRDLHGHWHHDVWVGGETDCQHIWVCGEDEDKENTDGAERSERHVTWCDRQTDQPPKLTSIHIWWSCNLPTTPFNTSSTHPFFLQSQYIYIHDAINDYINCKNTTIAAHELRPRIEETREIGNLTGSNGFITQFAVSRH